MNAQIIVNFFSVNLPFIGPNDFLAPSISCYDVLKRFPIPPDTVLYKGLIFLP